ncbi:hypothetical protein [Streptomyces roseifaciens]|uniref:hypothetical protein n=1 Tax=Streptomyces roseifaciens TaxID=1488406 RepID=UPI000717EB3F|nr:hypothetical protein [Streptomyces roseifaciens]
MPDSPYPYPDDLLAAQEELRAVYARLRAQLAETPWSVEPMPGWTSDPDRDRGRGYTSERPDSPGWTPEQQEAVTALRARARELVTAVSTHPFWDTVDRGEVVKARMALKHVHEQATDEDASPSA